MNFKKTILILSLVVVYQFLLNPDTAYSEQNRYIQASNADSYRITSTLNRDFMMDLRDNKDHVPIVMHRKNLGDNQGWKFVYDPIRQAYQILTNINSQLVLKWNINNNLLETRISDHKDDSQFWIIQSIYNDELVIFRSYKDSTKVIEYSETKNSAKISIGNYSYENTKQQWDLEYNDFRVIDNGKYLIRSSTNPNLVLDTKFKNPWLIYIHNIHRESNQKWHFIYDTKRNAYKIVNDYTNIQMTWDQHFSKKICGRPFDLYEDQYWRLEEIKSGSYIFRNLFSTEQIISAPSGIINSPADIHMDFANSDYMLNRQNNHWILEPIY